MFSVLTISINTITLIVKFIVEMFYEFRFILCTAIVNVKPKTLNEKLRAVIQSMIVGLLIVH